MYERDLEESINEYSIFGKIKKEKINRHHWS